MDNTIWDKPLTPDAKLVGIAAASSGSDDVAVLSKMTGLSRASTERAIRQFKSLEQSTPLLSRLGKQIASKPVSDATPVTLVDITRHFNRLAREQKVKTHKSRLDYARLRAACRRFGVVQVYDRITDYFKLGNWRSDANMGVLSFLRYLNRAGIPKRLPMIRERAGNK